MPAFNKVILIGNLTRDPELRYTNKGTAFTKLGLAINRSWTTESGEKKEEVTFVDVDVFARAAENAAQYLRRGRSVMVEGRLKLDQWDDKQTGQKKSRLSVVSESIQYLGPKQDSDAAQRSAEAPQPDAPPDGDEVPF
jgi:single-strand DNA-binding protein